MGGGPVRLFILSQCGRGPVRAALSAALALLAIGLTRRVWGAGLALAVQGAAAALSTVEARTRTPAKLAWSCGGPPVVRFVAFALIAVAAWQWLCVDRLDAEGETDGRMALRYGVVVLVCLLDGIALGRGAEVDISKGGLGVAASLMGFDVIEKEIDEARTTWERCLAASCVLLPAIVFGLTCLQKSAWEGHTHLAVRGRHQDSETLALTSAPVLLLAATSTLSVLISTLAAWRMHVRYQEARALAERAALNGPYRGASRSHFRMFAGDALAAHPTDDTPGNLPQPSYGFERISPAGRDEEDDFGSEARLLYSLKQQTSDRNLRGSGNRRPSGGGGVPSGPISGSPFTRRSGTSAGDGNVSNAGDGVAEMTDSSSDSGGADDDLPDASTVSGASPPRGRGNDGLGPRHRRCCGVRCPPAPIRRSVRTVFRGGGAIFSRPYTAGVMVTAAVEMGIEAAILCIFLPVSCITLPFLGGPEHPLGHGEASWHAGLAPGLLWTSVIALIVRACGLVGDQLGGTRLQEHLQDMETRDVQGFGPAMERPSVVRLLLYSLGVLCLCGAVCADLLFREGVVGAWAAAAIFAGSLGVSSFLRGLTHATTGALQRDACVDLPNQQSIFAAVIGLVYVAEGVVSCLMALALDRGPRSLDALFAIGSDALVPNPTTPTPLATPTPPSDPAGDRRDGAQDDSQEVYYSRLWAGVGFLLACAAIDIVVSAVVLYHRRRQEQQALDVSRYEDQFALPQRSVSDLSECSGVARHPATALRFASPRQRLAAANAQLYPPGVYEAPSTPRRSPRHDGAAAYLSPRVTSELVSPKSPANFDDN